MIEFAAVIQHIEFTADATRMTLDISIVDVSGLADLIDREVTVTVTPPLAERTKRGTRKERTSE